MSLVEMWKLDTDLKSDLSLQPSWPYQTTNGLDLETPNPTLPDLNLENHLLDKQPSTSYSFSIEPPSFDNLMLIDHTSDQTGRNIFLAKRRRKVRNESRNRLTRRIPQRKKILHQRRSKRKQESLGDSAPQKKKLATFPQYADISFDDDDSDYDSDDTDENQIDKCYQFIPSEEYLDSSPVNAASRQLKESLVQFVAASLVSPPSLKREHCESTERLKEICFKVAEVDPEFVLKVALYGRQELNIRSASNYLVAFSATHENCRKFVKKYYKAIVVLPSDWIEIAEFCTYQKTYDRPLGVLPICLRRSMVEKFPDFDMYQLGKYNKTNSKITHDKLEDGTYPDRETRIQQRKDVGEKLFNLKQLIRQLHISKPARHVMGLLGKKYPEDLAKFYKSGLDGTFDDKMAGQRMKLPVPETWETQISLQGNKANVWESLIDNKKLPYMAMLRNLRNLIKAQISSKHEKIILKRLSDEKSVIRSRQLPTQFFSAYSVLENMEKALEGTPVVPVGRGNRKRKRPTLPEELTYTKNTLDSFRTALDDALKVATTHNLEPIKGKTIIICCLNEQSSNVCSSAKGFGKSWTIQQVSILLGLMCHYSCEHCELIVWNEKFGHVVVIVDMGTILENIQKIMSRIELKLEKSVGTNEEEHKKKFHDYLYDKLKIREKIDTLIQVEDCKVDIKEYKTLYRLHVSPDLLFVNISLTSNSKITLPQNANPRNSDITIKGFSVQLLNFIATYRNENQLMHVDNIDTAYNLKEIVPVPAKKSPPESKDETKMEEDFVPLPHSHPPIQKKTVRVFISSTFNDMHGERDLLTRFIFPKLRKWAERSGIDIYEVDLRWGIPEEEARSSRNLELCLTEVSNCDLFIGILGERYGWIPSAKDIPSNSEFDWIRNYPNKNASITELEMYLGALSQPEKSNKRAFFFFRNNEYEMNVPKNYLKYFMSENSKNAELMEDLKERIRNSGVEVFDGYPADFGGVANGKAFVSELGEFGARVFHQIRNAVEKLFDSEETDVVNEDLHQRYVQNQEERFVGRKILVSKCLKTISKTSSGVVLVTGRPGCGKSAIMAKLIRECVNSKVTKSSNILVNIVGASPDSMNIMSVLTRFCWQMKASHSLQQPVPKDYMSVITRFQELLVECAEKCEDKMLVFIDGLDYFEDYYQPYNLAWLSRIPKNVVFVLSAQSGEYYYKLLHSKKIAEEFVVGDLQSMERAEIVRHSLVVHRKALEESIFNNQMRLLTFKTEATSPFFLKLACEELRVFGVFEKVSEKLKCLPPTIPELLQEVFNRLEQELGKDVIQVSLSLISCAKSGLMSMELFELLNLHWKIWKEERNPLQSIHELLLEEIVSKPDEDYLPRSKFVRLQYVLQHFLNFGNISVRSNVLIIKHKLTKTAIQQRYLSTPSINYYQRLLAAFFYQKSDCEFNHLWTGEDPRTFSVLPYHLVCSGSLSILISDVLCNLHYIYSMFKFGLGSLLLEYFSPQFATANKLEKQYSKLLMGEKVSQYKMFITRNLLVLSKCPSLLWQQVANCPTDLNRISLPSKQKIPGLIKLQNRPKLKGNHLLTIDSFPQPLTCVALCEQYPLVACGSEDGVIYLLDSYTGKGQQRFIGHSDAISDVSFVGGSYLCSASLDTTLSFWDVQNGHRISIMKGHKRKVVSCCVNSNKDLVASASLDKTARIWNPHKGEQISYFSVKWPVNCIAFHPEGNRVIIGCWDSTLQIWDILSQSRIAVMRGHKSSVQAVAYSPSGKHVMSSSIDGDVKIWAANKGIVVGKITGQSEQINKIAFNPQGSMMATIGDDCKLKLWSSQLGTLLHSIENKDSIPATCICLSPQMSTFAVGYHDGKVRQFDLPSGEEISVSPIHQESITCIKYSLNEDYLVTGSTDSTVKLLHTKSNQKKLSRSHHSNAVLCVDICSKYMVSSSLDMTVCVYEIDIKFRIQPNPVVLTWHDAPVTSCALNFDETFLATAGRDMNVVLWDLAVLSANKDKTQPLKIFSDCHNDWITDCKWLNYGTNFVTASNDFNLKVWNLSKKEPVCELVGHTAPINSVSYRNGIVVSCSSDGCTKVWSDKGYEITSLYKHPQRVNCCDVKVTGENHARELATRTYASVSKVKSADLHQRIPEKQKNIILATCGDSGLVQIWEPIKALELACLTGHTDRIVGLSCKKDLMATCSVDGSLRLWSPPKESSEPLLTNLGDAVTGGDYDPITSMTILSCRNGTIQLWDCGVINPKQLITTKLSNYSINCICFCYGQDNKTFATGSDNDVTIWNLIPKGKSLIIRKKLQYKCDLPVHSLVYSKMNINKAEAHVLVSAGLCGQISVYCSNVDVWKIDDFTSPEPILKFSSLDYGSKLELLTIGSEKSIQNWTLTPSDSSSTSTLKGLEQDVSCSPLMAIIPENVKLTSACNSENFRYVGLSNGHLLVENVQEKSTTSFKLHPGTSIEQILDLTGVILTAGADGVIKVWESDFKQIGEFHCSAAVTCLINLNCTEETINFMAGDMLGYVYCLSMKL